jgi:EAL and modified HD-GYP domain-containing signal transduction protein
MRSLAVDIFVARQPILDRKQKTVAYELLFRDGLANSFPDIDGDTATFRLLSNTFFSMGVSWISKRKPAFINFPQTLIEREIPLFFPKEDMVIEILEDIKPTAEVIKAVTNFKKKGFRIALDDFVYYQDLTPLIEQADIIKFDFRESTLDEIEAMIVKLSTFPKLKFLAEKVETHEEFKSALDLGCSYFQGYFFEKPMVLTNRSIPAVKVNLIRLISLVSKEKLDFPRLSQMIRDDVSISFRLLKFINSAYYQRKTPIDSVKDAIILMGEREIRQFILLIASAGLAEGKPQEIITTSIMTGRMCELLGKDIKTEFLDEELFTIGLFRSIDAMLDMPMAQILKDLPFRPQIKDGLMGKSSTVNHLFGAITDFIRGDWDNSKLCGEHMCITVSTMKDAYQDAITMADEFMAASPASQ